MKKKPAKSKIDLFIISRVKERRENLLKTQEDIAVHLDVSTGYIGHIESPNFRAKYNTGHLNELAKLLKCSPRD
ncbi:MAG TPA: helix-turn-helix transcriptional regulator, partial [Puia sp.]